MHMVGAKKRPPDLPFGSQGGKGLIPHKCRERLDCVQRGNYDLAVGFDRL